ncbi:Phosphoenolpyruvate phosphomutase [Penicillium ucsense]|uniref:Phosphoenolpyruvate phosphomutase n=1 Tax=Penicillium ucsense TaxID=2839758 RepID=A0A8J8VW84_9EURO|nr:Phosphoenolpyruvate phosphomutase [Penicillium ucsense]KAF7729281.1 Phosphoenolpyruvate phosphomutase [Penicillium ucsense]
MSPTQNEIAQHFRTLHNPLHPLILTNIWDASSATTIASLPQTRALATASYAIAASLGIDDAHLTQHQNLSAIQTILTSTRRINPALPITVDLQDGYAQDLPSLAALIKQVIALGAVGCNLEDVDNATGTLRPLDEAVARVRTVMQAARQVECPDFVLNARTDVLFQGGDGRVEDAVERGKAFLEAGAWTVFVWGGPRGRGVSREEVRVLVRELQGRVSVKMNLGGAGQGTFLTVREIRELGVARVSVGPELWRIAMKAIREQAELVLSL